MENASKALIMAAGILIGLLIISLAAYLFTNFGQTAAEINKQNAQTQIIEFNSRFTAYENKSLTIYDVITIVGYAKENNEYYENLEKYKITVKLEISGERIYMNADDIVNNKSTLFTSYGGEANFKIDKIEYKGENGRVSEIVIKKSI